jgi:cysteine desulfurase
MNAAQRRAEERNHSRSLYLDHNATTAPLAEVVALVTQTMKETWANPSSAHWFGSEARCTLEEARDGVCELVRGAFPEAVVFTSGGTEANNIVVLGGDPTPPWRCVIASKVEHASILRPVEAIGRLGCTTILLDVDADGLVDVASLERAAASAPPGPLLVAIQTANSETGTLQPIAALSAVLRAVRPDAFFHADAAQSVGRVSVDLEDLGADSVSFSAHKLGGPQGVGALVMADPEEHRLAPLTRGGGQERGLRSGTHNLPGIAGLGLAARLRARRLSDAAKRMLAARDTFEASLLAAVPGLVVNGAKAPRLPNTSNVRFSGRDGMSILARLDLLGIACSQGSACSSGKPEPSHVLRAMGLSDPEAYESLRFSFADFNEIEDGMTAARVVAQALETIA